MEPELGLAAAQQMADRAIAELAAQAINTTR